MPKPIILPIAPFDATVGTTINFTYSGNQSRGFEIKFVSPASPDPLIYSVDTMLLSYTLSPMGPEYNGIYGTCSVRVRDINGVYSDWSDQVNFMTLTNPIFRFTNLSSGQQVGASEFEVELEYSQEQGELINSFVFELYGANRNLISKSRTMYFNDPFAYTFRGLDDNRSYYLRATGTTVNGITLDTGYISFSVSYTSPSMWNYVDLFNNKADGNIRVSSNVRVIDGVSEYDVSYVQGLSGNKEADLTSGNKVSFPEGYNIDNDFNLLIAGRNFVPGQIVLEMSNGTGSIKVHYIEGSLASFGSNNGDCSYFMLTAECGMMSNQIITKPFARPSSGNDYLLLNVKRIGYYFDVAGGNTNSMNVLEV